MPTRGGLMWSSVVNVIHRGGGGYRVKREPRSVCGHTVLSVERDLVGHTELMDSAGDSALNCFIVTGSLNKTGFLFIL